MYHDFISVSYTHCCVLFDNFSKYPGGWKDVVEKIVLHVSPRVYTPCDLSPALSWGHVSRLHYKSVCGVSGCSIIQPSATRTKMNLSMIIPTLRASSRVSALWCKRRASSFVCGQEDRKKEQFHYVQVCYGNMGEITQLFEISLPICDNNNTLPNILLPFGCIVNS